MSFFFYLHALPEFSAGSCMFLWYKMLKYENIILAGTDTTVQHVPIVTVAYEVGCNEVRTAEPFKKKSAVEVTENHFGHNPWGSSPEHITMK